MQTTIQWNLTVENPPPSNTRLVSHDRSDLVICCTDGKGNWWINDQLDDEGEWEPVIWAIAPSFPIIPAV